MEVTLWAGIVGIPLLAWFLPLTQSERQQLIGLTLFSAVFVFTLFHWLGPRFSKQAWLNYVGSLGAIGIIAYLSSLLEPYNIHTEVMFVAVIACTGAISGKRMAAQTTLIAIAIQMLIPIFAQPSTASNLLPIAIHTLSLGLVGFVIGSITGIIHDRIAITDRQNRYLSTLLQASILASHRQDLHETLNQIAERITQDVPVTMCHISLLSHNGDQLIPYGAFPLRKISDWQGQDKQTLPVSNFPNVLKALESGQYVIVDHDKIELALKNNKELYNYFLGAQTICLLPLIAQGEKLGIIAVGEARNWKREPFDQNKLDLLQTLANQVSAAIYNNKLYQRARQQATRLAMLNEVARVIGSTIELDDLLELIYQQVRQVIPAESYFVSLYDETDHSHDVRVLIDNGERFPPTKIPIKDGLSSWVLQNRRPLLVRHLTKEQDHLPVQPIRLGGEKMSESWLGMPLLVGDELRGLLAIASYTPYAFREDDVELLGSVASQAALAIDNARHHAEVEEQARRDSLTNAYNHGYFLQLLHAEINEARKNGTSVALIMLDIDYFKAYNDRFGHLIGDDVLVALVATIQEHIKTNDILGRWGGEEFGIVLPNTTAVQAFNVAERIRLTLTQVVIQDSQGSRVPSPTVSQGIASYPQHAMTAMQLVDIADRALYRAKGMGRDQIVTMERPI